MPGVCIRRYYSANTCTRDVLKGQVTLRKGACVRVQREVELEEAKLMHKHISQTPTKIRFAVLQVRSKPTRSRAQIHRPGVQIHRSGGEFAVRGRDAKRGSQLTIDFAPTTSTNYRPQVKPFD
eukprot:981319-Pyramimonas_sp.AAC.1